MTTLTPRKPTPELEVETVDGGKWRLSEQSPDNFTMIVAYRGFHCPICKTYLRDLDRNYEEFSKRGINTIAVSTDVKDRAVATKKDWGLEHLPLGYGMSIETARNWGLYISTSKGKTSAGIEEPEKFSEPGLFLVRPDGTLYAASFATMPFARPHFKEVLSALDMIIAKDYPARGEA